MMISNLFSIFDPSIFVLNFQLNWISSLIIFFLIPYSYWIIPSRMNILWNLLFKVLFNEMKLLLSKNSQMNLIFFLSLLIMIMINNFMGLFPYVFTSSSHMAMTLSLSLLFWISVMLYGWLEFTENMFAHLVPMGTPKILMVFMVLIETISNFIRPGTLAIRLSANMIAGHLLLSLIGSTGTLLSLYFLNLILIGQILLMVLEMSVSLIQAYVFCVLNVLYSGEIK